MASIPKDSLPVTSDYLPLLHQLVEMKSLSGQEQEKLAFIESWLKEKGLEVIRVGENVLAHIKGQDSTRAFMFNSHADTVLPKEALWDQSPWTPTHKGENGERLHGIGVSDMIGGLTASALVAEAMASAEQPPVDMWFAFVIREEVDGAGSEQVANWLDKAGYLAQYQDFAAVFTEPTYLTQAGKDHGHQPEVVYSHRGNFFLTVTAEGPGGHASRPDPSVKQVIPEVINFAQKLQEQLLVWGEEFPGTGHKPPTAVLTGIQANLKIAEDGENLTVGSSNKIPEQCIGYMDVRTMPGLHEVFWERVQALAVQEGVVVTNTFEPAIYGFTDPSDPLVQVTMGVLTNPELKIWPASADMGFFTSRGVKAVIVGPGQDDQAHAVNEYIYHEDVPQAVEIYLQIVAAWSEATAKTE